MIKIFGFIVLLALSGWASLYFLGAMEILVKWTNWKRLTDEDRKMVAYAIGLFLLAIGSVFANYHFIVKPVVNNWHAEKVAQQKAYDEHVEELYNKIKVPELKEYVNDGMQIEDNGKTIIIFTDINASAENLVSVQRNLNKSDKIKSYDLQSVDVSQHTKYNESVIKITAHLK